MSRPTNHLLLVPRPSPLAPRAFTFIEVLFAIIILGIGSIMIAGMLPVAIKQTSDTRNAITGKAACEAGYAYLQAIVSSSNLPATNVSTNAVTVAGTSQAFASAASPATPANVLTVLDLAPASNAGKVIPLSNAVVAAGGTTIGTLLPFQSTIGSRVLTSDPRTQWLAFYRRDLGSSAASLIVLALHLNNTEAVSGYVQSTPTAVNTLTNADNGPFLLSAEIVDGGALGADKITLTNNYSNNGLLAAETGAFVIVANSPVSGADTNRPYRNNGRLFRLGNLVSATSTSLVYELQPGYDLPPANIGADGLANTVDDDVDGSMNTIVPTNTTPYSSDLGGYRVGTSKVPGQAVPVWIVGKGLQNPGAAYDPSNNPYVGLTQDVGVLTTQVQLNN